MGHKGIRVWQFYIIPLSRFLFLDTLSFELKYTIYSTHRHNDPKVRNELDKTKLKTNLQTNQ